MSKWFGIKKYSVDSSAIYENVFIQLTKAIPDVSVWFGKSAAKITSGLKAQSISSSLFIAFAKTIGNFIHAIQDIKTSLYISPPGTIGDRWIEHIRNTYQDYGLTTELNSINWDKDDNENITSYENRLKSYATFLVNLFRKQTITKKDLEASLQSILPGAVVEVFEPITELKPWAGPDQYEATQFESNLTEYESRLSAYDSLYKARKRQTSGQYAQPNTHYPVPVMNNVIVSEVNYTESTNDKVLRLNALKEHLGSYNNLGRSQLRRFSSAENQGGRLRITINSPSVISDILYKSIESLKAAGIYIALYVKYYLSDAEVNSQKNDTELITVDLGLPTVYSAYTSQRVVPYYSKDL